MASADYRALSMSGMVLFRLETDSTSPYIYFFCKTSSSWSLSEFLNYTNPLALITKSLPSFPVLYGFLIAAKVDILKT